MLEHLLWACYMWNISLFRVEKSKQSRYAYAFSEVTLFGHILDTWLFCLCYRELQIKEVKITLLQPNYCSELFCILLKIISRNILRKSDFVSLRLRTVQNGQKSWMMQENGSFWNLDKLVQLLAAALALSTAVAESWIWLENYIATLDWANVLPLHAAVIWSTLPRGSSLNWFV